VRER
jgi:hypothetical protein